MSSFSLRPLLTVCAAGAFHFLALHEARAAIDPGEILIAEMNCVACHTADAPIAARLLSRPSPRLDAAHGVRLNPAWTKAFLENPQGTQPGTLMPDLLGDLEPAARSEAAEALTHYLVEMRGSATFPVAPVPSAESIRRGNTLYHTAGCVACHAPQETPTGKKDDAEAVAALEKLRQFSVPIGDLNRKYQGTDLAAFLQDPLKSRPGGRMPSLKLTAEESQAISAYLLQLPGAPPATPATDFVIDPAKAKRGQELYTTLNCAACHQGETPGRKAKPLALLNGRQPSGCLGSRPKVGVPKFEITPRQRVVILAQLGNQDALKEPLTPEQQITRTMTTLNCYACHSRERRGGVDPLRRDYFTARSGKDAPDEARIPPSLKGVGTRLSEDWQRSILVDGKVTRPDMLTRMPLYGVPNIRQLPGLYIEADKK